MATFIDSTAKPKPFQTIYLDLMEGNRYIGQLPYRFCPIWGVNAKEVRKYVLEKRPSLRNREFTIQLSNNRVR